MDGNPDPRSSRWWWATAIVALAGLAALATNVGFANHDELELLHVPREGHWLSLAWWTQVDGLFYRPLGYAAFCAQMELAGGSPPLVHALSVAHHLVNVALLGLLLRRFGCDWRPSLLALFLATAVPGVAWAAAVYDRLAVTWCALALLAFTRSLTAPFGVVCAVLALMSKETAAPLLLCAAGCAWASRGPRSRAQHVSLAVICTLAVAFGLWRAVTAPHHEDYSPRPDTGAAIALLRFVAFPWALGAEDPRTVWGLRWLGLIGTFALVLGAWRVAPRRAIAGVACVFVPLAAVASMHRIEGHYLYAATPGLVILFAALLQGSVLAHRLGVVLAAVALVHAWQVAIYYRELGAAMNGLQAAQRTLTAPQGFEVQATSGPAQTALERFVIFAARCNLQPRPVIVGDARPGTWEFDGSGQLRQRR